MPLALINASTLGSISPGSGGGVATTRFSGRPSHCARLKTVKRLRNGIACASSPVSARVSSRLGNEAIGIDEGGAVLALADIAAEAEGLAKRQPALGREALLDHRPQRISTLIPE